LCSSSFESNKRPSFKILPQAVPSSEGGNDDNDEVINNNNDDGGGDDGGDDDDNNNNLSKLTLFSLSSSINPSSVIKFLKPLLTLKDYLEGMNSSLSSLRMSGKVNEEFEMIFSQTKKEPLFYKKKRRFRRKG
jgi:hypothetical protein